MYNYFKDKESNKNNCYKVLLLTRLMLLILGIIKVTLHLNVYDVVIILVGSYLVENWYDYLSNRHKEDLIATIALAVMFIASIILYLGKVIG